MTRHAWQHCDMTDRARAFAVFQTALRDLRGWQANSLTGQTRISMLSLDSLDNVEIQLSFRRQLGIHLTLDVLLDDPNATVGSVCAEAARRMQVTSTPPPRPVETERMAQPWQRPAGGGAAHAAQGIAG